MSFALFWPIALIVLANIFYHVSSKGTNPNINIFASLVVTYLVSIIVCIVLLIVTSDNLDFTYEIHQMNFATVLLAVAVTGLESGFILMYKFNWDISIGSLVCNILLAICLVVLGVLMYGEVITVKVAIGIILCLIGLVLINKK